MKIPTFLLTIPLCNRRECLFEQLSKITYKDTIPFVFPLTIGKVIKVYDGDTITIASKLPYEKSPIYRFPVRFARIDSAEIKGETKKEKDLAILARDALSELIFGKIVLLKNVKNEKFGRVLAEVYLDDVNVNDWMLEKGFAVKYDGGKKQKW